MNGRCPFRAVYMSRQDCEVLKLSSFGAIRTTGPACASQLAYQDGYKSGLPILGDLYIHTIFLVELQDFVRLSAAHEAAGVSELGNACKYDR